MIDIHWNNAWNILDRLNEEALTEVKFKSNFIADGEEVPSDVYHFYSTLPDLVNSLRNRVIYSNKNVQGSQHDRHAVSGSNNRNDNEAFVCFTTKEGADRVRNSLDRPFGISIKQKT